AQAPLLAVDTETSGLQPTQARLVGLSLSIDPAEGYYVPLQHDWGLMAPDQIPLEVARKHLAPLLAADAPAKVGHHMKFDELILRSHGMPVGKVEFDTMLASYLLDPEAEHGLKAMAQRELRETMKTYEEVVGKQARGKLRPFAEVPLEEATPYAAADAAITLDLVDRMRSQVESAGMGKLLYEVEIPLSRVLTDMEAHGVLVDIEQLRVIGRDLDARIGELEKKAKEAAGRDINVNSPKQLEELLFDELGLPIQRRTKTGRSTDAETLDVLSEYHPLPGIILELRQMTKLKGTYVDALPLLVNPKTGRIHTSFNQTVAATGRLSSSDPNLQNIPIRTDEGRKIRSAFVAAPGHSVVAADYSQIELRLLAHFSKDPVLLDTFQRGEDIHTRTAVEMFSKPAAEITGAQRRAAKTINFGVVYGIGDSALAKRLDITKEEAARYIEVYFQRYAGVRSYFDRVLEEARLAGGVGTLLGRRRFLPALSSSNRGIRLQAERIAQNTPIQGTAADILKLAMVGLREPVVPGATMVLTVHDELLFEVPHGHEQAAMDRAREVMEGVGASLKLDVPLRVEAGFGRSWADAHG
ncbi:MAG: DNA polymerase I, partial [Myxococcales bacterium]